MSSILKNINDMTKTYLHNIMQILVFQLGNRCYYGTNVSKVRSIEDINKYPVIRNDTEKKGMEHIFQGYINYHDSVIPFLNVEQWLGIDRLEVEHKAILIIEFNQSTIAFPIHNFERIHNVPIENLQTSHCKSDFVTYTTLLEVAGREVTCMVMDVEKLLFDVFGLDGGLFDDGMAEINSCKKAYIAEDSSSARRIVSEIMGKTNIEHRMFNNGKEIIECLKSLDEEGINDIGVIITDLEMPYVDGYQVLSYIKNSPQFKHIPVFVNTSMSNEGVITKVEELGAVGFVAKTNPKEFIRQIEQHILR